MGTKSIQQSQRRSLLSPLGFLSDSHVKQCGHSHNFWGILTTAYFAHRTNCRSNCLWLVWCRSPSNGRHAWLHNVTDSGIIFFLFQRVLVRGHTNNFLGCHIALYSWFMTEMLTDYNCLSQYSVISSSDPSYSSFPTISPSSHSLLLSILFPLHAGIYAFYTLEPSLILSFMCQWIIAWFSTIYS